MMRTNGYNCQSCPKILTCIRKKFWYFTCGCQHSRVAFVSWSCPTNFLNIEKVLFCCIFLPFQRIYWPWAKHVHWHQKIVIRKNIISGHPWCEAGCISYNSNIGIIVWIFWCLSCLRYCHSLDCLVFSTSSMTYPMYSTFEHKKWTDWKYLIQVYQVGNN